MGNCWYGEISEEQSRACGERGVLSGIIRALQKRETEPMSVFFFRSLHNSIIEIVFMHQG